MNLQIGNRKLVSMQVGAPVHYEASEQNGQIKNAWQTSFFRIPSSQPRKLYFTHLEGNAQADTKNHGGPQQAALFYAEKHYAFWRTSLQRPEIGPGGFGENFTVSDMDEEIVCVGDIYKLGEALVQISWPRYPCWKIERRWGITGLTAQVAQSGRTGWYCSVLQEGIIEPGVGIELLERPYPDWTIALMNNIGHGRYFDQSLVEALAHCPILEGGVWPKIMLRQIGK